MITTILATDVKWNIWNEWKLLIHISEDLKRFKKITSEWNVIMWRKTFDSIISILWKPLPWRTNFIITKWNWQEYIEKYWNKIEIINSMDLNDIKKLTNSDDKELFVIWWAQIYNLLWNKTDKIELTLINKDFWNCDAKVDLDKLLNWFSLENNIKSKNEKVSYDFKTYIKN